MTTAIDRAGSFDKNNANLVRYLGLNPDKPADQAAVAVCQYYGLDPVLKHVVVIPGGGVYITRDGLLHVAHRSGQLDGIVVEQEPVLTSDKREWVARVSVWRKDMSHPFTFPGRYPVTGGNRQYAPEMALKAAEAHALRRAFSVSGLPALDERRDAAEPEPSRRASMAELTEPRRTDESAESEPADPDDADPFAEQMPADMFKAIHAGLRNLGLTERADKLDYLARVLGRDVDTSKSLTLAEGLTVLDDIARQRTESPTPADGDGDGPD